MGVAAAVQARCQHGNQPVDVTEQREDALHRQPLRPARRIGRPGLRDPLSQAGQAVRAEQVRVVGWIDLLGIVRVDHARGEEVGEPDRIRRGSPAGLLMRGRELGCRYRDHAGAVAGMTA